MVVVEWCEVGGQWSDVDYMWLWVVADDMVDEMWCVW